MRNVLGRRHTVRLAALAAALPLTAACSGIGSEEEPGGPSPASQETTTITFVYIPDPSPVTEYYEDEVARFEEANPDINVELQSYPGQQYANSVELLFSQGEAPDVFRLQPANQFADRAYSRGWIRDLNEYADDDYRERFPEAMFNPAGGLFRDGELIGIPLVDGGWAGFPVLYYNPDLLAEYGFDGPPSTWDELETMATTVSEEGGGDVYGFGLVQLWERVEEYANSFGEPLVKGVNPLTGQAGYSQDNYTEAVEYFQGLVATGAVTPGWQNFGVPDMWPLFANSQVAMYMGFPWNYTELVGLEPGFEVEAAPVPSKDGASARAYLPVTAVPYWAISSESEHPDQAWAFIDFLTTEESQARFYEATGVPPALTPSIGDEIDEGVLNVLNIGEETTISAPDPRFVSAEGRQISTALADKITPADLRDALINAVDQNQPWGPIGQQLDDQLNTAIDDVIAELEADSIDVSRDDIAFPDWDPNSDFEG